MKLERWKHKNITDDEEPVKEIVRLSQTIVKILIAEKLCNAKNFRLVIKLVLSKGIRCKFLDVLKLKT